MGWVQASKLAPVAGHWPVELSCLTGKCRRWPVIHDRTFVFHKKCEWDRVFLSGKCYFRYRCGRLVREKADVSHLNTPQAWRKFLQLKHLHFRLQCHPGARYLMAHSRPHSLLVAMEKNCSVCRRQNTKYSCIVCGDHLYCVFLAIAKKIIGLESARRVLMVREVRVSFCWRKVKRKQKTSTNGFFFHDTTEKQWKCWKTSNDCDYCIHYKRNGVSRSQREKEKGKCDR